MTITQIKYYSQLIRFDKPIGTLLLLYPTLWGLWLASNGKPSLSLVCVFSFGVFLTRSAGCAINDFFDADFDKFVDRTQNRPITSGMLDKKHAVITFCVLSLLAFALTIYFLHWYTIIASIPVILILATYPLMKRYIKIPQLYLGIAYSLGIVMVFIEIKHSITNPIMWCLWLANLFWVIGFDTIYAMVDISDDLKIGIKSSAITFNKHITWFVASCYGLFIILLSIIGYVLAHNFVFNAVIYWFFLTVVILLLSIQIWVLHTKQIHRYFNMFLLNSWVGAFVLFGIILSLQ